MSFRVSSAPPVMIIVLLAAMYVVPCRAADPAAADRMLAHMVYFDLKDESETAKEKMVEACHKYLKNHPGIVFFAAGTIAQDMTRDVNVRDFHVSLHIVFKTKADHDRYQSAPDHGRFIEENQSNWARVRVLDSYVR